jgi:creatinine amidohydrolase/Fe(II)-dependent formamide hydrolase-like protein
VNEGVGASFEEIGNSNVMSHADEIETSVYLHLNESAVQLENAIPKVKAPVTKFCWRGWVRGKRSAPPKMMDHWSRTSDTDFIGDPTLGTAAKGERFCEAAAGLAELIKEYRTIPIDPRGDRH